ncbi:hypothetical protein PHO31112_00741 [Pandoraea horticolens]|uniref:Uncharacterized protein n=1 Tax=Pandoraea horticolens TaxID=2508298 RepID=A0A5E4SDZ8_9BURK|nr:hypothetical protein [Pandoraea horticolens]VVD74126.1 hypothetical protein PHO31112_00741 [Pandoraea horticolens]
MVTGNINSVLDGEDRVTFKVRITNGEKTWTFDGFATHDALLLINATSAPLTTFEAKRSDYSLRAQELWCQKEPLSGAMFLVTVDNLVGGYVVGNG